MNKFSNLTSTKGQKKSKFIFQVDVSSKKMNEQILLYYYETSGRLAFVRFLEEIEDTQNISKLSDLYLESLEDNIMENALLIFCKMTISPHCTAVQAQAAGN